MLTDTQIGDLLNHVKDVPDRYWLYRLALETGLRASELRSLTVGDFDLGDAPSVRISAAYAKANRTDEIPLSTATTSDIKAYLAHKLPAAAALVVPLRTAKMLREDLEACGIDYTTMHGLKRDFHALRHTFLASMGYHVKSIADLQRLARHSKHSVHITIKYLHPEEDRVRAAVESASRSKWSDLVTK